jgi:NAD(P)-dependent dehydrogenase (short-subunit alcohol dehydrogenase family)
MRRHMKIDLGDAVLVVTGAAQGIGAEIAAQAAAAGVGGLLLTDRNGALGREMAARLARLRGSSSWRPTSPRSRARGA